MHTSALPLGAKLCTRWGHFPPLLSNCGDVDLSKVHMTSGLSSQIALRPASVGR